MDGLASLFNPRGLLPHAMCLSGAPGLLWGMVAADAAIALAYFSIPVAILQFVRRRGQLSPAEPETLRWLPWLFSAFIFACGTTHLMDVWTLWQPDYAAAALGKGVTAVVSVATAVLLWPLIPRALKIPSVAQLQALIATLEAEVERRRTAEQHSAELEQSLAVTLASIEAGFVATDTAGRITRMNEVAERVTGWPQAQALGQPLATVLQREGWPGAADATSPAQALQGLGLVVDQTCHGVVVARDGQRTTLALKAGLTQADGGQVRGLALVFRDMTPLNRAEADRDRLVAIVESSHDAIIGKTLDGTITSWNGGAERLFGHSAAQAIGQPVQMLIPPELAHQEMRILSDLASDRPVPAFNTVRLRRDGRPVEVSVSISPIHDATGRIVGASKIVRDVSQQRLAEAARLKALRLEAENLQITEANRLKSLFLANMSHELRTPLNAIIGFAELLHAGTVPRESPKHQHFLGHIASSGHHLLKLINDVLDLSKVEAGKMGFHPEPLDLPTLVSEALALLQEDAQRKQLQVRALLDPSLTGLVLDPSRLRQVLYNYLSNAIKFTPAGGRISVQARPQGSGHWRIEVHDTGIGIAPADLPRLFGEFQQLDTGHGKRHPGTGLGLALTRRLVAAQGGQTGVHSTPGAGSVFWLVLPRVHRLAEPVDDLAAGAPTGDERWLVIEQDQAIQHALVQALSQAGWRTDPAGTAEQAVQQAAVWAYAGISLGLQLPGTGGLAALQGIRGAGPSRGSPVRSLSLGTAPGQAATLAITNLLRKPLDAAEVTAAVAALHPPLPGLPLRVMVVDDDPIAQDLMRAALQAAGVQVQVLSGGHQALAALASPDANLPDAIVLDLMMPGFDGFATLDALRSSPATRHTPVFIWTSMVLTDEEYRGLHASAQAILAKGGGAVADLVAALRQWRPQAAALPGPPA